MRQLWLKTLCCFCVLTVLNGVAGGVLAISLAAGCGMKKEILFLPTSVVLDEERLHDEVGPEARLWGASHWTAFLAALASCGNGVLPSNLSVLYACALESGGEPPVIGGGNQLGTRYC